MANIVIMPRQGQSVESCIITKWHVKTGDAVKIGDLLFSYETDKATFDEEAKVGGTVLKILREVGDDVPCLENVLIIGESGEDISALSVAIKKQQETEKPNFEEKIAPSSLKEVSVSTNQSDDFVRVSPRARELAKTLNLDYKLAKPSGAEGRIIERDISRLAISGVPDKAAKQENEPISSVAYTEEKLSNMRKVIARAMSNSLANTAQLTHISSFDATEITEFRKKLKLRVEKGEYPNITLNDIVLYAVSRALTRHKSLNANLLNGDTMRYFTDVNLGMACDTPRGLMVPVLFGANKMSLNDIAVTSKKLAKDCQSGSISPDLIRGGSFTVSNVGMFGVEAFTPVLNAPETGILGVGTITTRVKVVDGGIIKAYPSMSLSLTYDHRALDGAPASRFLQEVCMLLENWSFTLFSEK